LKECQVSNFLQPEPPHFEAGVAHHCYPIHGTQSDAAGAERFRRVVPFENHMTVDFDFHMGAAFQNSDVMRDTGGPSGQARTFSDQCEAGILAQTIGDALRFRVAAPVGIGVIRNCAAMIGRVVGPARWQGEIENVFALFASRAKEDDGQSIRRPFGPHVELDQKVFRKYAAIPYHHMRTLSGPYRCARRIEGRWRHAQFSAANLDATPPFCDPLGIFGRLGCATPSAVRQPLDEIFFAGDFLGFVEIVLVDGIQVIFRKVERGLCKRQCW